MVQVLSIAIRPSWWRFNYGKKYWWCLPKRHLIYFRKWSKLTSHVEGSTPNGSEWRFVTTRGMCDTIFFNFNLNDLYVQSTGDFCFDCSKIFNIFHQIICIHKVIDRWWSFTQKICKSIIYSNKHDKLYTGRHIENFPPWIYSFQYKKIAKPVNFIFKRDIYNEYF